MQHPPKTPRITYCRFGTVSELFQFKEDPQELPDFPGYTPDQWGIKAHNRPYVEHRGNFQAGERIVEVGGAYSRLPEYLAHKYNVEAWSADDFGESGNEAEVWQRWGNPDEWIAAHPTVTYVKQPLGVFSDELPDNYFDCVFSVSTLEHIPKGAWARVFEDMIRITRPGGRQIHLIDIPIYKTREAIRRHLLGKLPGKGRLNPIVQWISAMKRAGVVMDEPMPSLMTTLDRQTLVESPDVVFRFYSPNERAKQYRPNATLAVHIAC